MAVTLKMDDMQFFKKLVEQTGKGGEALLQRVEALKEQGAKFSFGFLTVMVEPPESWGAEPLTLNLPATTSAIMKGTAPASVALMARMHVESLITEVEKLKPKGAPPAPQPAPPPKAAKSPPPPPVQKTGPADPDPELLQTMAEVIGKVNKPAASKIDLDQRVKLSQAAFLNQAVHASDAGSMYRVIGLGSVNIAARVKSKKLSIRAEGSFTPQIVAELGNLGLKQNPGYMSAHFDLSECPAERIMGAILYAKGLQLKSRIPTIEELKNGA